MPISPRPADQFTRDNLLLGFSVVSFEPALTGGGFGTAVPLGILSGEALQKAVETLTLERGDSGPLTVDREIVSRLEVNFQLETFNFRADLAQYIFGSDVLTAVVSDPAKVVTDEEFQLPSGADAGEVFTSLNNGSIDESSITGTSLTCKAISQEDVGTGDGTTGDASGDFALAFKPLLVADVTSVTVNSVAYTPIATGAAAAGNEVEVEVGATAVSGNLQFFVGGVAVNVTGPILADYAPSHAFALNTDYSMDPLFGRIRVFNIDGGTDALKSLQLMEMDYTYEQKAGYNLTPFTQREFEGRASIQHLTDIGVNFDWQAPSVTIRLTDDDLTFGAEDFATATLRMNINDAGGSQRFGTLFLANEVQANS